jgi:hypothetical protein
LLNLMVGQSCLHLLARLSSNSLCFSWDTLFLWLPWSYVIPLASSHLPSRTSQPPPCSISQISIETHSTSSFAVCIHLGL